MKKILTAFVALTLVAVLTTPALAQELTFEQRDNQVSYNGNVSYYPAIAFNGKDFAAFYTWSGVEDAGNGLYMRRINASGQPIGPQMQLLAREFESGIVSAVWDGKAYIVFAADLYQKPAWSIVRVDTTGKVLAKKSNSRIVGQYLLEEVFPFVIGDTAFLFFTSNKGENESFPYVLKVDRELKQNSTASTLPTGAVDFSQICGVALDPEKFLVLLGATHLQGEGLHYVQYASLLHIGFDGEVKKTVAPVSANSGSSNPAAKMKTVDLREVAGPYYTGDGYLIAGTRNYAVQDATFAYINSTLKIDDTGEILSGPYNLGGTTYYYLGYFCQLGQNPGLITLDYNINTMTMSLLGPKGKHIKNVDIVENYGAFPSEAVNAVYYGGGSAVLYFSHKSPSTYLQGSAIYSNIITDPASAKPQINYLQVSSSKAFGDTRRFVMWSISAGSDVTLKGKGFKMKGLPPVYHTVVDTKGKKTKLRLRFVGTDGKNKKSKLVINP